MMQPLADKKSNTESYFRARLNDLALFTALQAPQGGGLWSAQSRPPSSLPY